MTTQAQNVLVPSRFQCVLTRLPNTVFYLTSVNIPGLSIHVVDQPTPFNTLPVPGDRVSWNPLTFRFYMDTTFSGWHDVFNWLTGLGRPVDAQQYANLSANSVVGGVATTGVRPPYSDATINIYTSKNNLQAQFHFHDVFPVSLDDIPLTYSTSADEVIDAGVTFAYSYYEFTTVS